VGKIELLDNIQEINRLDRFGMLKAVERTTEMLVEALELARGVSLKKGIKPKQIVVSGMGGSAIAGDVVADLLTREIKIPIYINRDYNIPAFVGEETLFFSLSYSGNTEETLSALAEARKRKAQIVCVTSGGKMKEWAESSSVPLYLVPAGYQPRSAYPYLLIPILQTLQALGLLPAFKTSFDEAVALLQRLNFEYGTKNPLGKNPAKKMAKKLQGKIPLIFSVNRSTRSAGLRLKTQLNENSKETALFNVFPELNHNEIVSLSALKKGRHKFCLLLLRDDGEHERIQKRIKITKALLQAKLGQPLEIKASGTYLLTRILSLILFGDYLSCYLAFLKGVDPTPIEIIERLKKELMQ
jgi:glucose/mannose-6-phosphate isomerase